MNILKSILLVLAVLTVLTTFGCRGDADDHLEIKAAGSTEVSTRDEETAYSLYALGAEWTNQNGAGLRLGALRGRPVVMAMVFTNCRYACPIIVHDMKRLQREMPEDLVGDIQFVLVSLDPERDHPEALARFARSYGLDDDRWTLLQGDAGDVRTLAAVLGVKYKKEADGQYSHTNLIALLNEQGEMIHREINPGGEMSTMMAALRQGTAGPSL